jgi:neural Wiskott-Aldrich syndrome protein
MTNISDDDNEAVLRAVPSKTNKILFTAIARLYIAYPNPRRWTYSGLQGAVVLVEDLVGHTFWLKMVDISVGLSALRDRV